MQLFAALKERRSIRAYQDKPVEEGVVKDILEAAVHAPSGNNGQPWGFVVIQDQAFMQELSDKAKKVTLEMMQENPALEKFRSNMENPQYNIYYHAPVLILIYGDKSKGTYYEDCVLAAENLMLAAWGKGLGSCWINSTLLFGNNPDFKQKYQVPENYELVVPLVLGYPAGDIPVVPHEPAKIFAWSK